MCIYIFAFPDIFAKYRNFAKHPSLYLDGKITYQFVFPDFLEAALGILWVSYSLKLSPVELINEPEDLQKEVMLMTEINDDAI